MADHQQGPAGRDARGQSSHYLLNGSGYVDIQARSGPRRMTSFDGFEDCRAVSIFCEGTGVITRFVLAEAQGGTSAPALVRRRFRTASALRCQPHHGLLRERDVRDRYGSEWLGSAYARLAAAAPTDL